MLELAYGMANSDDPYTTLFRAMFTCFLNTGVFDSQIVAAYPKLKPKSARNDHVGHTFLELHCGRIFDEFMAWVEGDLLAQYILSHAGVRENARTSILDRRNVAATILGKRIKRLVNFDRARMPADLRKSFYKKVENRISKAIQEYEQTVARRQEWIQIEGGKVRTPSMGEWLRLALTDDREYLPSKHLREIRSMRIKFAMQISIDDMVCELMKLADCCEVMTA